MNGFSMQLGHHAVDKRWRRFFARHSVRPRQIGLSALPGSWQAFLRPVTALPRAGKYADLLIQEQYIRINMKKTLVYTAAVAATLTCGASFAQSNVTMSGTLDIGVFRGYDDVGQVDGISRSNLAFSGSEDLGSGNAVTFKLSTRFTLSSGALEDPKSFWAGESTVGLKGSYGHVRFGRALTAMWNNDWAFDPWYNYDSIASPAWWLWHGNSPADANFSATGPSFARINNGVFYDSPSFGGVSLHASVGVNKKAADKQRNVSLAVKYGNGPLNLMASHEQTTQDNTVDFVAASYTVGPVTVMGAYDSERLANGGKNRSVTTSLRYTMGAITLNAGYGRQLDYDANFIGLGAIYALSKRTNVYVSVGNQGKGLWGRANSQAAYGAGVNHSF